MFQSLTKTKTGVQNDPVSGNARLLQRPGALCKKMANFGHHIFVKRLVLHGFWLAFFMHQTKSGIAFLRNLYCTRGLQRVDVVDHAGAIM